MSRILDSHQRSVAFLYPTMEAATDNDRVGATGFVASYRCEDSDRRAWYLVTNLHVVDSGCVWVRFNRTGGGFALLHLPVEDWFFPIGPDDFAVIPLVLPHDVQPHDIWLDQEAVTRPMAVELKVGCGDDVYMVGRFVGHGGRVTNNPIARFGSVSLMPDAAEPVRDGRGQEVEAYLTEMRSHAGFSGSPVFLSIPHMSFRGTIGDTEMDDYTDRFRFLGIDTGHLTERIRVRATDPAADIGELAAEHNSNVAIVAPAWKLLDLVERADLVEQRQALVAGSHGRG